VGSIEAESIVNDPGAAVKDSPFVILAIVLPAESKIQTCKDEVGLVLSG